MPKLYFLLLVCALTVVPFLVHLILVRLGGWSRASGNRQKGAVVSGGIGLLPTALLFYLWCGSVEGDPSEAKIWAGIYLFLVYILASYTYFHLFNMSETARRVRILMESSRRDVTREDRITDSYTGDKQIEIRIERLLALKELYKKGDRYVTGRGILVLPARVVARLHCFIFPGE